MASAGSVEFQLEANLTKLKQDLENAKKNIASFSKEAEKSLIISPRIRINANSIRTKELGRSISDGIVRGMDTKQVESAGKKVAESLVNSVKRVLQINSPSKVFQEIGEDIVDGLSGGVRGKIKYFTDNVKGEVNNLVTDLKKQSPTAQLSFTGLAVGVAGVAMFKDQIIGLGKSAINTAVAFESLNNTINIVAGSASKGASKFSELKSLASELGVDLRTLSSGYAKLSASTANTQLQGADTDGMIRAISQAGVAYGLTNEQLNGTIVAMSQMAGKGVVSMEELRQQLAERIPGAMGIAARAMKMTERELFDLVSTGTLSINDFWPKFYKQLAIETPLATETSRQSFARLGNEITEISMKAGQALLPIAKGVAEITTEVLKFVSANFDTILKGIAVSFGAIAIASVPVFTALGTGLTAIAGKLGLSNAGVILASIGFKGLLAILGPLAVKAAVLYAVLETGSAVFNLIKDQLGGSKSAYSDWSEQVTANVEKVNKTLLDLSKTDVEIKPPRLDKNKIVNNNNWFADLFSMSPENIEKSVINANKIREKMGKAPMSESEVDKFRERARSPLGFLGITRSKGQNEADKAKINLSEAGLKSNTFSDLIGQATEKYKAGAGPLAEVAKIDQAMKSLQSKRSIIPAGDVNAVKQLDAEMQKLNAERNKLMSPLEGAEAGLRGWLKLNQDKYAEYLQALKDQYSDDKEKRDKANAFLTTAGNDDQSMEQVRINAELASKALGQYEQAQKASGAVNETQKLAMALAELGTAFENVKSRIDQINISKLTEIGKIELSGFDTDIFNSFNAGVQKAQQGVESLKQEIQDRENITKKLTKDLSISPARQSAIQLISDEELKKGRKLVASEIDALAEVWGQQDVNLKSALESESKLRSESANTAKMKLDLLGQELALKQAIEQQTLAGLAEERSALQALNKIKNNDATVSVAQSYKEGLQTNINAESDFNVASAEQALISLQANTNEVAKAIDRLNQKRLDGLSAEKYNEQIRQLSLEQSDLSVQTANAEIAQIKAVQQARADDMARRKQELESKINIDNTQAQSDIIAQKLAGGLDENGVAVALANLSKTNNQELTKALEANRQQVESAFADGAMNLRDYTQQVQQIELERVRLIKSALEDEVNIRKAIDQEILANIDKQVKEQQHLFQVEMMQLDEKSKQAELASITPKSDLADQLEKNKVALTESANAIDQMKVKLSEVSKLSPSPENTQKILELERELNQAVLAERITILDQQLAIKNKIKDVTEMEVLGIENQLKISSDLATLEATRSAEAKARANLEMKVLEGRTELAKIELGDSGNYEISVKLLDRQYAIQRAINKAKSDQAKADLVTSQKALDMDYQREQLALRKAEIENRQAVLRAKSDVLIAQQSGNQLAITQAKQQLQISSDALGVILQQQSINNQNHAIKKSTLDIENKSVLAEEKIAKIKEKQAQIQSKINLTQSAVTKELDKQKSRLDAIATLSQTLAKAKLNGLDKQAGFLDQALTINTDLKGEDIPDTLRKELKGQLDQLTGGGANNNEKKLLMDRLALEEKMAREKLKALAQEHSMQKALLQIELTKQNMVAQMAVLQAKLLAQQLAQNGMAKEGQQLIQDALEAQQQMASLGDMAMKGLEINQGMERYNQEVDNFTGINSERRKVSEAGYTPLSARPAMPQYEVPKYKPMTYDPNQIARDAIVNTTGMVDKLVEDIGQKIEAKIDGVPGPSGNTATAPVNATTTNQSESVVNNNVTNNTTLTVISSDPTGDARKVLTDLAKANKNRF